MFTNWKYKISKIVYNNKPQIFSGIACAGVIATAIFSSRNAIKAAEYMKNLPEEKWRERFKNKEERRDVLSEVGTFMVIYTPTIISGSISIASILLANHINANRMAVLAGLYSMAKESKTLYKEKIAEKFGKGVDKSISNQIDQEKIEKLSYDKTIHMLEGEGSMICYDPQSGRYFKSDYETIRRAVNDLNKDLLTDMFVSLNDLYYELHIPKIALGDDMGWYVENGLITIEYDTMMTPQMEPCIVIRFDVGPKFGYH